MQEKISIIIPAVNEAQPLARTLASAGASAAASTPTVELIVVDGGSQDATAEIARSCGARILTAPRGRAQQMNAGARIASGDIFLFLHADTCLPPSFASEILSVLSRPGVAAGAFQLRINGDDAQLRWVERAANWRARRLQLPYGDQGLFLRAALFRDLGGYPEIPLMEDVELVRKLRRHGRIAIVPRAVVTSPRRWERLGVLPTTLLNQFFLAAYFLGMPPRRIAQWYYR